MVFACHAGELKAHLDGRGTGLAGYLGRELLSGAEHDELRFVWLSGGVSGLGWLKMAAGVVEKHLGRFF